MENKPVHRQNCAFRLFYWVLLVLYTGMLITTIVSATLTGDANVVSAHLLVLTLVIPIHLVIEVKLLLREIKN